MNENAMKGSEECGESGGAHSIANESDFLWWSLKKRSLLRAVEMRMKLSSMKMTAVMASLQTWVVMDEKMERRKKRKKKRTEKIK